MDDAHGDALCMHYNLHTEPLAAHTACMHTRVDEDVGAVGGGAKRRPHGPCADYHGTVRTSHYSVFPSQRSGIRRTRAWLGLAPLTGADAGDATQLAFRSQVEVQVAADKPSVTETACGPETA